VVESSLGVPTGCAGKLRWQTAGMFGEAVMAGTHKAREGASGGCDAHAGSETSVGTLQAR
jgi:hypothetical protein